MRKRRDRPARRATIEVILESAARVLGERGWAATTTNAVAETAGVSIGSLYQYFPNKLALVEQSGAVTSTRCLRCCAQRPTPRRLVRAASPRSSTA